MSAALAAAGTLLRVSSHRAIIPVQLSARNRVPKRLGLPCGSPANRNHRWKVLTYEKVHLAPSPSFRNRIPRPRLFLRTRLRAAWRWSQRRWWRRLARRRWWRFPRRWRRFLWWLPRRRLHRRLSWRRSCVWRSRILLRARRQFRRTTRCKCRTSLVLGKSRRLPRRIPRMASVRFRQPQRNGSRRRG